MTKVPFDDALLQSYTNEQLIGHINSAPYLCPDDPRNRIRRLSPRLLAKKYCDNRHLDDALAAMEMARRVGVRVPHVPRTAGDYMVMQYVCGRALTDAWPTLGWLTTIHLALVLRRYVRAMRTLQSPTAGSLATGSCRSYFLKDYFGLPAHARPCDIQSFIDFWAAFVSMRHDFQRARKGVRSRPLSWVPRADDASLVLTHHDLAPRNLLLDNSGKLWVLDWDFAGWYPQFFEYAAIYNFRELHEWSFLCRLRWHLFVLASCGYYMSELRVLTSAQSKFTRFGYARRVDIAKKLQPSSRPVPLD